MQHRRLRKAVVELVERSVIGQPGHAVTIDAAVAAFDACGRRIEVRNVHLPWGVFGRWVRLPDRDVFEVAEGLATREWTIAHELGHMMLGHDQRWRIERFAGDAPSMLRSCGTATRDRYELEAERFAALLLDRLRVLTELSAGGTQELLG